jgi:type IV pilus assembly protein PilY1
MKLFIALMLLPCDELIPPASRIEVSYTPDLHVAFIAERDSAVRAVDVASDVELWRFDLPALDRATDLRVLRFDANRDGVIDPAAGDRMWIYFGVQRARSYVALDATERTRANVLWSRGPEELPGIGEAWSVPSIARVDVAGVRQNEEGFVMIVGGGFSEATDAGHRMFMLDAETGARLWFAGGAGGEGELDFALPAMRHAIPARVSVLDTDGDGFADRLYTADLGGQLWRFDVANGGEPASLVVGGVLASLAGALPGDARRFFHPPDVALVRDRDGPYFSLALGSGDRRAPLDTVVEDRFYSIRDRNPFTPRSQEDYDARAPILDEELVDVTAGFSSADVPASARGWKVDLRSGEKVLSDASTVDGTILFTTYTPAVCAEDGINRLYALKLDAGKPALDLDADQAITDADASLQLMQRGAAGELRIALVPAPRDRPAEGEMPRIGCWLGQTLLPVCVDVARLLRTFWRRGD